MLHLFQSAAFPLGIVRITEQGTVTEYDKDISPYDYTVYTSIMCGNPFGFIGPLIKTSRFSAWI